MIEPELNGIAKLYAVKIYKEKADTIHVLFTSFRRTQCKKAEENARSY